MKLFFKRNVFNTLRVSKMCVQSNLLFVNFGKIMYCIEVLKVALCTIFIAKFGVKYISEDCINM